MPTLVAFDLDGVLYSSEPFIADAYREAIELVNQRRPGSFSRVPPTREILDHVGWPVSTILARLFPSADAEAIGLVHGTSLDVICARVRRAEGDLYAGVTEGLLELRRMGHRLAVASNGRREYVTAVLETYEIVNLFEPLVSVDQVEGKGGILAAYLTRLAIEPLQAVMVGDRASDVEAAAEVGCRFVGCDYGHGYREEIAAAGPIVGRFSEIPRVISVTFG
jgi:phosphoglycolate phosphatase